MTSIVVGSKGELPSKACRATPSIKSPNDMSRYSAKPLSTFSTCRLIRTPVWHFRGANQADQR